MTRVLHQFLIPTLVVALFIPSSTFARPVTEQLDQFLHDHYVGKAFAIREFRQGDRLKYDSSGTFTGKAVPGDWTSDGFIRVEEAHSGQQIVLLGRRLLVTHPSGEFGFTPAERRSPEGQDLGPDTLEIAVDFGSDLPSADQIDAAMSKVFLTQRDTIAEQVPEYWYPCVHEGLKGKDKECLFSPEILAVPGMALPEISWESNAMPAAKTSSANEVFHVGGGVSPPRVLSSHEPEFSDAARGVRYKGIALIGMIVNAEGTPTHVHIMRPLGAGLDAKAVQAVQSWKFKPAEKNNQPVAVEIAVEVNFRLY